MKPYDEVGLAPVPGWSSGAFEKGLLDEIRKGRPGLTRVSWPSVPRPPVQRPPAPPSAAAPGSGRVAPTGAQPVPGSSRYFKDSAPLRAAPLPPGSPVPISADWPSVRRALAATYNRLGGLMGVLATEVSIPVAAVLAVWHVESGGRRHQPGRAIIRFENHLLFDQWGRKNAETYDRHFRHGGRSGETGERWQNHKFREDPAQPFMTLHVRYGQDREYRALSLAIRLAGRDTGLRCISIGGPQILVRNHRYLGYRTPHDMYAAFQASERWHVLGFFDFCRTNRTKDCPGGLLKPLREMAWRVFARCYNGAGQVDRYGGHIKSAFEDALAIGV